MLVLNLKLWEYLCYRLYTPNISFAVFMSNLTQNKKKILLLLTTGAALALNRCPGKYFKILGKLKKGWEDIEDQKIKQEIRDLYRSKLVNVKNNNDGTFSLILTEKGKQKVLRYDLEKMRIKSMPWDGKWRTVLFDIPERQKPARDALRNKLKRLGFFEFQKSVFVHPFDCGEEIDFLAEFFQIKPYVRYGIMEKIDNELYLRRHFAGLTKK